MWSAPSTCSELCGRTSACCSLGIWVPAGAFAGRAGTALRGPGSSSEALPCSSLSVSSSGGGGARPTCIALLELRGLIRGSFSSDLKHPPPKKNQQKKKKQKTNLSFLLSACRRKDCGRRLFGEEAVAGRFALAVQASGGPLFGNAVSARAGPSRTSPLPAVGPHDSRLRPPRNAVLSPWPRPFQLPDFSGLPLRLSNSATGVSVLFCFVFFSFPILSLYDTH